MIIVDNKLIILSLGIINNKGGIKLNFNNVAIEYIDGQMYHDKYLLHKNRIQYIGMTLKNSGF